MTPALSSDPAVELALLAQAMGMILNRLDLAGSHIAAAHLSNAIDSVEQDIFARRGGCSNLALISDVDFSLMDDMVLKYFPD